MKILVILSRIPYPLEKGDKLRAFNQVRELSKNNEIILFCLNDTAEHEDARKILSKYCSEIYFFHLNKISILTNLIRSLFNKKPYQVAYFYNEDAQTKINSIIREHKPDRIFCQLIRTTEYVKDIHTIPKTLDYMDVLSKGIERRIKTASFLSRPFFKQEFERLVKYEREVFNWFNTKTIISKQDRDFIQHPDKNKIEIIPNGVDLDFFKPMTAHKEFELVFTGNMSYPPNVDSVVYLGKRIMPLLLEKNPDFKLLIAGSYPALEVLQYNSSNIHVTGWVDNIKECYAAAKIFIAPMQIGTGLQNKLLEAMAMKLPCITSPLANNALGAKPDHEILIAETPEDYCRHILFLLNNPDRANELAENGYKFVQTNYRWDNNCKKLEELIRQ